MLNAAENKYITQVGPGTPMGNLFRRYWLPAMLASELPEPDCAPVKLRLLGEDLVAFRTTSGRIGVIDAYCPHRNANLYWGRNEDEGLRCVYHGWKFDTSGACVDMPNEPASSRYAEKVKQAAYQATERGGVIWVYMGPAELAPELPGLEWTVVPESHRMATKRIQACNYLQNLEGEIDSSHVSFLHRNFDRTSREGPAMDLDQHPVFFVKETDYGMAISARREDGTEKFYWRVTPFMLPSYTMIPGSIEGGMVFTSAIPMDDETMIGVTVSWRADRPLNDEEIAHVKAGMGPHVQTDAKFNPLRNKGNDYAIDRELQKASSFTGIKGVREQDMAVQEDQRGRVSDRTREHLGTTDLGVIAARRRLIKQARDLEKGIEPPQARNAAAYRVRSAAVTAVRAQPWEEAVKDVMVAQAVS
ncbi:MAG TPA: Rieske 2Fe-2S domain-containing protein [Dehalococcoidia bacterium]|nr:Rieske 2Fe-2S domain-containing protein [Dehalococcoidia bacterium]